MNFRGDSRKENEEEEEAVCGFILMLYKLRPSQSKSYEWISEETVGQMKEKEVVEENEVEEGVHSHIVKIKPIIE